MLEALNKQYGFDKPVHVRYWIWLKNIARLDFGESFTYEEPVIDVIMSKFPVSLQFGVLSLLLSYLISIPLGVMKAVKHGSRFDGISSFVLFVAYSVPSFMLAIVLIVFLSGGSFLDIFPIGGLYSDFYDEMSCGRENSRSGFTILSFRSSAILWARTPSSRLLMKNSLMEEVRKDYIRTARAKGVSEKTVYLKHAFAKRSHPYCDGHRRVPFSLLCGLAYSRENLSARWNWAFKFQLHSFKRL